MKYKIIENSENKLFLSREVNYYFNKVNGFTATWGKTKEDDAEYCKYGPIILDVELSTICHKSCSFCYKSNNAGGKNMSFKTFKIIFDKLPKTVTQIAFGIGDIDANPDMWKIMNYCRDNGVIPNITINGERMTSRIYTKLAKTCGAVAVSLYDKDTCYNAVKELTDRGMEQVNIHALLSKETYDTCYTTLLDRLIDKRLEKLNAVVFLWLKPKGNRNSLNQLDSMKKFKDLISLAMKAGKRFGFDSCTAPTFLEAIKDDPQFEHYKTMAESCESFGLFSGYINTEANYFPCSFAEGEGEWANGISVLACKSFDEIWQHPLVQKYREKSLNSIDCNGCRKCLIYDLGVK